MAEMEAAVQLIVQTGALGLLAYLIFWATRTGVPSITSSMNGIKEAVDRNTARLTQLEQKQVQQTEVLSKLLEQARAHR